VVCGERAAPRRRGRTACSRPGPRRRGDGAHKGAQIVQLATNALAQAVVDEKRNLGAGGSTGSHALSGCLRSLTATVRAEALAGGVDLASTLTSACVGTRPSCWACAARPAVRAKARRRAGVSCLVMALD